MKRHLLTASSLIVLTSIAFAAPAANTAQPAASAQSASTAKPAANNPTANLAAWENAVRAREQRASLLRDEIKALDARIETRIDSIIKALRSIADSKDSRTKVAR